jgi:DnaJ-class molecular chaperone
MKRDYYSVLGVAETASLEEIQDAYRRLAKEYHPDSSGADTIGRFHEIQEAWETLRDVEQRRRYDRQLRQTHAAAHRSSLPFRRGEPTRVGASRRPAFRARGEALHLELQMTATEAALGGEVLLELPAVVPCGHCQGRGYRFPFLCPACLGEGRHVLREQFLLRVPPGLHDGAVVHLPLDHPELLVDRLVLHITELPC